MKKLIILFIILFLGACMIDYKDIRPEKPVIGTKIQIDSTQWTPVLIQENGGHLMVYDGREIKKIAIVNTLATSLIIVLLLFFICILIFSKT